MTAVKGQRWADVKPCGTEAAYKRHQRRGEKPCLRDFQAAALARQIRRERRERAPKRDSGELLQELIGVLARLLTNPPPPDRKTP